jgi:hypothetical protein
MMIRHVGHGGDTGILKSNSYIALPGELCFKRNCSKRKYLMNNCCISKVRDSEDKNTLRTKTEIATNKQFVREFQAYASVACIVVSTFLSNISVTN